MQMQLQIKMNDNLFLHNPQETELGKNILHHSILLIHKNGLEDFTFKKLAAAAGTTEASVYRYFENKHRLLTYLVSWYWSWLDYQISFTTNNVKKPEVKLKNIIRLLATPVKDDQSISYINESILHEIVVEQGAKAYLTKHVAEDNKLELFKPYKDLCHRIGDIILEYNPDYKYPHSLSSTIIEIAHLQKFFKYNLPSLTDFGETRDESKIIAFIEGLFFCNL
jgi:AcrR family transcriptional regulator